MSNGDGALKDSEPTGIVDFVGAKEARDATRHGADGEADRGVPHLDTRLDQVHFGDESEGLCDLEVERVDLLGDNEDVIQKEDVKVLFLCALFV